MSCNISPEIWRSIVWPLQHPVQMVFSTDGFRVNLISFAPFTSPTTLTSNESAHSKQHEMYLQSNSLPKSILTTSRNGDHIFRNRLQTIQSILQSVKLRSLSKEESIPMYYPTRVWNPGISGHVVMRAVLTMGVPTFSWRVIGWK